LATDDNNGLTERADKVKIYVFPNLFTAGNLFFGFLAMVNIIQATRGEGVNIQDRNLLWGLRCMLLAVACDFLDGRVARFGGYESPFGREFDSLADLVSFGIAPALLVQRVVLEEFPKVGWVFAFVYLVCGALRLARFNVIHAQAQTEEDHHEAIKQFVGFPIPAAAGLIASMVLFLGQYKDAMSGLPVRFVLPFIMLVLSWAMVSTIPYPSFKNVDWTTQKPFLVFVALIVGLGLAGVIVLHAPALALVLPAIFYAYLFWGLLQWARGTRKPKPTATSPSNP
jgi:CDP-diacylglycerol--serine O-phosphatidyltransferase